MSAHKLTPAVTAADHSQGGAHAAITLVEYGDYECPSCGAAYPVIKAVQQQLGAKLHFVFRNFPLRQHAHAEAAAEVAEAAGSQGKFWEMHDMLYEHQDALEDEDLVGYATQLGLDGKQLVADVQARKFLPRIKADLASGDRSGVDGTPAFYVNGSKFTGDWSDPAALVAALTAPRA